MKKNLPTIVAVIACFLIIVCLFQINGLKKQISSLESNMNSRISNIEANQNSSISYVNQKIEEYTSLLSASDWTYESYDVDTRTVKIRCAITPKEHTPDMTTASLTVNGTEMAMELKNGEFVLVTDIPLFDSTHISKVVFNENGVARTEALDWFISPTNEYIPVVSADFGGNGHGKRSTKNADTYIWHKEGDININADCYGRPFEVKSVALVEEIDGVETARTNIPLDDEESYDEEMATEIQAVYEDNYQGSSYYFHHYMDKDFEIPFGSTMNLYIELVDNDGFVYRTLVDRWKITPQGELADDDGWFYMGQEASIYDSNGNALYIPEVY